MRRVLAVVVLTSVLGLPLSSFPALIVTGQQTDGVPQRRPATLQSKAKAKPPNFIVLASQRGADAITAAQLRDYLSFVASDEMEGRDTPSRGLDITARFLAMNMARWGLKGAGDNGTYFQKIALRRDLVDSGATRVELNGNALSFGDQYIPSPHSGTATGQLVFAGNGWFVKSKGIDSYKGVDAKGKVAIIFTPPVGLPRGINRSDLSGKRGEDWMSPAEYAKQQGVVGLVIVPDYQYLANWERFRQRLAERGSVVVDKFQPPATDQLPTIIVGPRVASMLFSGERHGATQLFELSVGSGDPQMPPSFELRHEKAIKLNIVSRNELLSTQNVVAVLEGTDPLLKAEYVALGAHYDHVGISSAINGDRIYNGADDDGSGTVTLLAIAEALAKARVKPKRSVLFVWHAGEEKGLWGSRYFTDYPTVPLDKIITHINLDMVGRSKQAGDTNPRNRELSTPNEIYVIGSRMMSSELGELTETVNNGYLKLTYNYRFDDPSDPQRYFFRSDHYNYARKGIPVIFFFDGEHEDYHRPGDSPDKIDYQKMEQVARTVYMTMWELATRANRPAVDKPAPAGLVAN